jgi:hypothetical protein
MSDSVGDPVGEKHKTARKSHTIRDFILHLQKTEL